MLCLNVPIRSGSHAARIAAIHDTMPRRKPFTKADVASLIHERETRSAVRFYDGDGSGLCVNVWPSGRKSWVQCITVNGRRRYLGLGSYPAISLDRARELAVENKRMAAEGLDPISERRGRRRMPDFQTLAERVMALQAMSLSPRTRQQWQSSMKQYVFPRIGRLRVDAVTVADVLDIVGPIWSEKRETANKVRRRIAAVLDEAIGQGYRADNPALSMLKLRSLPKHRAATVHHRSLPWADVPNAVCRVKETNAWVGTKLAFEFLVLTAVRSAEVRGAVWTEIDTDTKTWTIPAARMKAGVDHKVPLAPRAIEILADARRLTQPPILPALRECPLVFPSMRGKAMSDNTLSKLLRDHEIPATPHGFRASFRGWAAETTDTPHAVMEAALAHAVPSAVERAYVRTDFFDRRRGLMEKWAEFLTGDQ